MPIIQYWCPKHHTTKRRTRLDGFIPQWRKDHWYTGIYTPDDFIWIGKYFFTGITPICQICRKPMIILHGEMPKKNKAKKKLKSR